MMYYSVIHFLCNSIWITEKVCRLGTLFCPLVDHLDFDMWLFYLKMNENTFKSIVVGWCLSELNDFEKSSICHQREVCHFTGKSSFDLTYSGK